MAKINVLLMIAPVLVGYSSVVVENGSAHAEHRSVVVINGSVLAEHAPIMVGNHSFLVD